MQNHQTAFGSLYYYVNDILRFLLLLTVFAVRKKLERHSDNVCALLH